MPLEVTREGRLLRVTLNRPEKRNALDFATCGGLVSAFERASADASVGAVLLLGAGQCFCSGMDLKEENDAATLAQVHERLFSVNEWILKPLIAAVQGAALAGGTGLVASAHVVVASDDAMFGMTEVRIGLWPVMIFPAVIAAVGERRAMEMALTTQIIDARKALAWGLVSEVVAPDELTLRAGEIARAISISSAAAVSAGLRLIREGRGRSPGEQRAFGRKVREELMMHADFAEGLSAFREKREARWPSTKAHEA